MVGFTTEFKFEVTRVKKQNSLYYSAFFDRWRSCRCGSVFDTVLIKSDTEITIETPNLNELVKQEIEKRNGKNF